MRSFILGGGKEEKMMVVDEDVVFVT